MAQQLFGKVHHVAVVPPSGVKLHHGELGVVAHADAFVAEAAVDFKHALKAAHNQALQIQFGRNAQEHILVKRIVVGDERTRIGTTWNGVQHGGFNL